LRTNIEFGSRAALAEILESVKDQFPGYKVRLVEDDLGWWINIYVIEKGFFIKFHKRIAFICHANDGYHGSIDEMVNNEHRSILVEGFKKLKFANVTVF
jgi:hypothetical protein